MTTDPGQARQFSTAVEALQRGDVPTAGRIAHELVLADAFAGDDRARMQLADLCMHSELFFDARGIYSSLEETHADDVSLHYKAGTAAFKTKDLANAGRHIERCVELRPEHPASYLQLGHIRKAERRFDDAATCYLDFVARSDKGKGPGYWSLADLKDFSFSDEMIAAMRLQLAQCDGTGEEASIMHFALAVAAEQQQDFASAAEHLRSANAIQAKRRPFREAAYNGLLDSIQAAELDAGAPLAAALRPIFIVGLPRSGTTLVEQILAAHSAVTATDELPFMERIGVELERGGGYGARLQALNEDEKARYRERYLREAGQFLTDEAVYFIDKNPNNFMHIGLIRALFPEALVINLRRELRDNAISIYRQLFAVGHDYSSGFDTIKIYAAGYLKLMSHWAKLFPAAIRIQSYEALVRRPEDEIAALLTFCGLTPEPACYEFYKSPETVMTPSASQVSQPMYTSSIGRWKAYAGAFQAEFDELKALQESP